jgi:cytochrome c|tara:strand:+ start:1007 stop:1258 length:252 start_codon:yes stop_codon:yes gene_type:complete
MVTLDENGDYVKAEEFMLNSKFAKPMDMIFASDGNLYVLEYGTKWRSQNIDARLNRISYLKGNRTPIAKIGSDKIVGTHPLKV